MFLCVFGDQVWTLSSNLTVHRQRLKDEIQRHNKNMIEKEEKAHFKKWFLAAIAAGGSLGTPKIC